MTSEPQTLTSVGYGSGYYDNNLHCSWLLDAPITGQVQVKVMDIDIHASPECSRDYLRVRDVRMVRECEHIYV